MESYRDIIDAWPSRRALAEDLGVDYETVKKWRQRDSIPAAHWPALVKAARRRKVRVTLTLLVDLAADAA